eukprot:12896204-Prorocentrum_lima.AAC.1
MAGSGGSGEGKKGAYNDKDKGKEGKGKRVNVREEDGKASLAGQPEPEVGGMELCRFQRLRLDPRRTTSK